MNKCQGIECTGWTDPRLPPGRFKLPLPSQWGDVKCKYVSLSPRIIICKGLTHCPAMHLVTPHIMMTSSNGNIFHITGHLCGNSPVPGEFPAQRPVTRSFDVFVDLRLNKRLSKQSWGCLFETLSHQLWRHCPTGLYNLYCCKCPGAKKRQALHNDYADSAVTIVTWTLLHNIHAVSLTFANSSEEVWRSANCFVFNWWVHFPEAITP